MKPQKINDDIIAELCHICRGTFCEVKSTGFQLHETRNEQIVSLKP